MQTQAETSRKRTAAQIERDLYWANHVAAHGTSKESRGRGQRSAEKFEAELAALAPVKIGKLLQSKVHSGRNA